MSISREKIVDVTIKNNHAIVTLTGPSGNALDSRMQKELTRVFTELKDDANVLAIVLKAEGPQFCVGGNIVEMQKAFQSGSIQYGIDFSNMFRALNDIDKPKLCVIKGAAVGGGSTLASLCHYTIAVPKTKFGYPEKHFGLLPFVSAPYVLKRIGYQATLDLCSREQLIEADEAKRIHLIDQVCETEVIDQVAEEKLEALKKSPALGHVEMPIEFPECKSSDSELASFLKESHRLYLDRSEKGKNALSEYTGRRLCEASSSSKVQALLTKYIHEKKFNKPHTPPRVESKEEKPLCKPKKMTLAKIGVFATAAIVTVAIVGKVVAHEKRLGK